MLKQERQMCETMQSSHRLCPVMVMVRALLAPTASGDGDGPSPAPLFDTFRIFNFFLPLFFLEPSFGPVNHGPTWKGWERSGGKA